MSILNPLAMIAANKIYLDLDMEHDASKLSSVRVDIDEVYGYEDTLAGGAAAKGIVITLNQ